MNLKEYDKKNEVVKQIQQQTLSKENQGLLFKLLNNPEDSSLKEGFGLKGRRGEKSVASQMKAENIKALVVSFIHMAVTPIDDGGLGVRKARREIEEFLNEIFYELPNPPAEFKFFGVSIETAVDYYYKHPELRETEFKLRNWHN